MAERWARIMRRSSPSWIPNSDLLQSALAGLWESAHDFDASRGASFEGYAWKKIRGAIGDYLRELLPWGIAAHRFHRHEVPFVERLKDGENFVRTGGASQRNGIDYSHVPRVPARQYDRALASCVARRELYAMTERQREVAIRRHWLDQDQPTMAKAMGLTGGRITQIEKEIRRRGRRLRAIDRGAAA